jgi:hypothetical protein
MDLGSHSSILRHDRIDLKAMEVEEFGQENQLADLHSFK